MNRARVIAGHSFDDRKKLLQEVCRDNPGRIVLVEFDRFRDLAAPRLLIARLGVVVYTPSSGSAISLLVYPVKENRLPHVISAAQILRISHVTAFAGQPAGADVEDLLGVAGCRGSVIAGPDFKAKTS